MIAQRYVILVTALIVVCAVTYAKKNEKQRCDTKENCLNNKQCQCYCSELGDFRDKDSDDRPVYVKDDPNGVYCYCKQWDLDVYPGPAERPIE